MSCSSKVYQSVDCSAFCTGGTRGIYFVMEEHRSKRLSALAVNQLQVLKRGTVTMEGELEARPPMEQIGLSHAVVLHKSMMSSENVKSKL